VAWARIIFAFHCRSNQSGFVTQPLALVLYDELMPGSQLVNRLQDLHYRVQSLSDPNQLNECAQKEGPMLVFADLGFSGMDICAVIAKLKQDQVTTHIPIIAFADERADQLQAAARQAGANLVVTDAAVLAHLIQLIEQALHAD
jgi:CheY-like chemotaxis protein